MIRRKRKGWWENHPEAIAEEHMKLMTRYRRETPFSADELKAMKCSYLVKATSNYFPGGYNGLRQYIGEKTGKPVAINNPLWAKLNEEEKFDRIRKILDRLLDDKGNKNDKEPIRIRPPRGFLANWDNMAVILKGLVQEDGYVAPPTQIGKLSGYSYLPDALDKYHGGYHAACERLGLKVKTTPRGGMRDENYVAQKLREVMKEYGFDKIPLKSWFEANGHSGLIKGIQKCGGLTKFRTLFGEIKQGTLEDLLKEYIGDD